MSNSPLRALLTPDNSQHKFNVYDLRWRFVGVFWNGSDLGLREIGDYYRDDSKTYYSKPVFIKRMS